MSELVVGLDQGTSSTRCVALDEELHERGVASVALESSFPAPGLVEQDPEAIAASAERAIASLDRGTDAAFLMRPTPVQQVRDVAAAGETMPPKSTYFFPKLLTGLVFNPLE